MLFFLPFDVVPFVNNHLLLLGDIIIVIFVVDDFSDDDATVEEEEDKKKEIIVVVFLLLFLLLFLISLFLFCLKRCIFDATQNAKNNGERFVQKFLLSSFLQIFYSRTKHTKTAVHTTPRPPFIREKREREEEKDGENDEQQESSDKISQSLFLTSCAVVSRL